ncbi:MAG: zinc transporter ZntB [Pseudomonadota bacterium]
MTPNTFAYQLSINEEVSSFSDLAHISGTENALFTWIHIDINDDASVKWLRNGEYALDDLVINALLADETRPRYTGIGDGAIVILRGVNLNENADPEDMISIRLWITKNFVISVQRRPLKAIRDMRDRFDKDKPLKSSGEFVALLVHRLLERMSPTLVSLDDTLDHIEEQMMERADAAFREHITHARRQALILRRYIAPQRDVIGNLKMSDLDIITAQSKQSLQESYNQNTKFVEDLDALRERGAIVRDELATAISDRLNKNMYILSVISAIFLPLGFLTGLLGVNIGGIPGTENQNAFYIFSSIMIFLTAIQIFIFKKLKWF